MQKKRRCAAPRAGTADGHLISPEEELLRRVLGSDDLARALARVPGGWRTQSEHELMELGFHQHGREAIKALQALVGRSFPVLEGGRLSRSADVGRVYGARLGGLMNEVMLALGLDGRNNLVAELEVAIGGAHGLSVTARDILRPLIRVGASAFVLVHNHPSGDPTPSIEDIAMTQTVAVAAELVGIPLVDHVVVGARGGGFASLLDLGVLPSEAQPQPKDSHEEGLALSPVSS
jgi:DNA repair protein RadC